LQEAERAARALGLQFIPIEVADPYPFEQAFATMAKARADGLVPMPSLVFVSRIPEIVALTGRMRLPAVFFEREFAEAGGLMAYGPNVPAVFRRAADYVDKILHGTKPADLPIWYPMKFELIINLRTANALGLTIPPTVRYRADQVIP
jgi:putative ABC transport system substrate-binding protein